MSEEIAKRLYELLPAICRIRDAEAGLALKGAPRGNEEECLPLKSLLELLGGQAQLVKDDIAGLYNNWFIETCDEWVVPYIGDLLGIKEIHQTGSSDFTMRAYVANTLAYRRRKGTATVLEQIAQDVTGWRARSVEFFKLLITTQNLNHLRTGAVATIDLRDINSLDTLGGPFEKALHTIDVRSPPIGKYNIPNIGLFLWRLQSYPIESGTAYKIDDCCYAFSPMGNSMQLFNLPKTEEEISHLMEEINVPCRIRQISFKEDLADYFSQYHGMDSKDRPEDTEYYGPEGSLLIIKDGDAVDPMDIVAMDLCKFDLPPKDKVAVDVRLGRIAFGDSVKPINDVEVNYAYGFSDNMGCGPYNRQDSLKEAIDRKITWQAGVGRKEKPVGDENIFGSLAEAVGEWNKQPPGTAGIITIMDSRTYDYSSAKNSKIDISIPEGSRLIIAAGDWPVVESPGNSNQVPHRNIDQVVACDTRPHLVADFTVSGGASARSSDPGRLAMNGLLIQGSISIASNSGLCLGRLEIAHCTLVPGRWLTQAGDPVHPELASIFVDGPSLSELNIDHSITGPLRLPPNMVGLTINDSIVESPMREGRAIPTEALLSGKLSQTINLRAAKPSMYLTIGKEGPYKIDLGPGPKGIEDIRYQLQEAIRSASSSKAFSNAQVAIIESRLLLLPGQPETVSIDPIDDDTTATDLLLDDANAAHRGVLISGHLPSFSGVSSASPSMNITIGKEGPFLVELPKAMKNLEDMKDGLQSAIRAVDGADSLKSATVFIIDDRIIVLPGITPNHSPNSILFSSSSDDSSTLMDLALESDRPAISSGDDGMEPGPKTALERTTVFGRVKVKELALASETIFMNLVEAERHQEGCVRFSYLPAESRIPRRYRCQPDLALAKRAEDLLLKSVEKLPKEERAMVISQVRPEFTSTRYGDPGYSQLDLNSAEEIRTGAEDGSEMGAFSQLKQSQREAKLRMAIDEYLRFGLVPGIFYVT